MLQVQAQCLNTCKLGSSIQSLQQLSKYQRVRSCNVPCQKQVRIVVVPSCHEEKSYELMAQTYAMLQNQACDKIILMCPARSSIFYGIGLPLTDDWCMPGFFLNKPDIDYLSQHTLCHYDVQSFSQNVQFAVQQAFCRMYLPGVQEIVPLLVGVLSESDADKLAALLAGCCSERTLIIMSADIAEHNRCISVCPLDESALCLVYDQDAYRVQALQSGEFAHKLGLFDDSSDTSVFALLFSLLQIPFFHDVTSHFIGYQTSLFSQNTFVSYAAFIYEADLRGYRNQIGSYEQKQLLQHARRSLQDRFEPCMSRIPCMMSYEMAQPHGVFACMYYMSDHGTLLQGSCGKIESIISLYDMTYQITQQAAFHDHRFYPLRQRDLDSVIVALSVITDFNSVDHISQIQETDGMLLRYADRQAVSLPLNLLYTEWDYQDVMCQMCETSQFSGFTWKKPQVQIFSFNSLSFQEE